MYNINLKIAQYILLNNFSNNVNFIIRVQLPIFIYKTNFTGLNLFSFG